jgi:hypothetical protein
MSTKPDFTGIWRLDPKRSKLMSPPFARMLMKIAHAEPDFAQIIRVDLADGRPQLSNFRGVTGGAQFVNETPRGAWHSAATWDGDELLIESFVTMGERKFHFRDHWFRSGPALVMQHRGGDLAGQIAWLDSAPDLAGEFSA